MGCDRRASEPPCGGTCLQAASTSAPQLSCSGSALAASGQAPPPRRSPGGAPASQVGLRGGRVIAPRWACDCKRSAVCGIQRLPRRAYYPTRTPLAATFGDRLAPSSTCQHLPAPATDFHHTLPPAARSSVHPPSIASFVF